MTQTEAQKQFRRIKRALRSHAFELKWTRSPGDVRAAISASLAALEVLAQEHPMMLVEINDLAERYAPLAAKA